MYPGSTLKRATDRRVHFSGRPCWWEAFFPVTSRRTLVIFGDLDGLFGVCVGSLLIRAHLVVVRHSFQFLLVQLGFENLLRLPYLFNSLSVFPRIQLGILYWFNCWACFPWRFFTDIIRSGLHFHLPICGVADYAVLIACCKDAYPTSLYFVFYFRSVVVDDSLYLSSVTTSPLHFEFSPAFTGSWLKAQPVALCAGNLRLWWRGI